MEVALLNKTFKSPLPPFTKGGLGGITGLTLIEVMIALVVALVVFLALMQTAVVGIDSNTRNLLRDEAVMIADQRMSEMRNRPFSDLDLNGATDPDPLTIPTIDEDQLQTGDIEGAMRLRKIRNIIGEQLNVLTDITIDTLDADIKQITVSVSWVWKGETYNHTIVTILRA